MDVIEGTTDGVKWTILNPHSWYSGYNLSSERLLTIVCTLGKCIVSSAAVSGVPGLLFAKAATYSSRIDYFCDWPTSFAHLPAALARIAL
jgi:hypothetical protein